MLSLALLRLKTIFFCGIQKCKRLKTDARCEIAVKQYKKVGVLSANTDSSLTFRALAFRQREGPMLETLV